MFKFLVIPEIGRTLCPQIQTFRTPGVAKDCGIGYVQALLGNYGRHADVVVVNIRTNEAVSDTRIERRGR